MGFKTEPDGLSGDAMAFVYLRADIGQALGYPVRRATMSVSPYGIDQEAIGLKVWPSVLAGHWPEPPEDPALALLFLDHNVGIIAADIAGPLAERIEEALERIPETDPSVPGRAPRSLTKKFIRGLREAASSDMPMAFVSQNRP